MARHFGVSARTVYRWVEALSMADVPVYAEKGKGGGIRISENYAIDKAVLTEREKLDVLAGIRTLSTLSLENASGSGGKNDGTEKSSIQSAIIKIQSLFRRFGDYKRICRQCAVHNGNASGSARNGFVNERKS